MTWQHTVNRKSLQLLHNPLTGSHLERSPQSIGFKSNTGLAFCPSCDPATKTPLWLEAIKSSGTAVQRLKHLSSGAIPSTELFSPLLLDGTLITRERQNAISVISASNSGQFVASVIGQDRDSDHNETKREGWLETRRSCWRKANQIWSSSEFPRPFTEVQYDCMYVAVIEGH